MMKKRIYNMTVSLLYILDQNNKENCYKKLVFTGAIIYNQSHKHNI